MSLTPSTMLPLGTKAPDFTLPEVSDGRSVSLAGFAEAKALLVMFICRHCPYVIHVKDELARLGRDYAGKGVALIGISSNDIQNYPDDAPEHLSAMARDAGFTFPVCHDETQSVARAYSAACTPDFFLFDGDRKLAYRGQLDGTRPGNGVPDGRDLRAAIDAVLAGLPVPGTQQPSTGCSIKWKPGRAPTP